MPAPKTDEQATTEPREAQGADRRIWPRVAADELTNLDAKLSNGSDIILLDLSRGGARLQSDRRMLPNSSLSLRLVTPDAAFTIAGRVVRSRIIKLSQGGLGYDVAVVFNEPLQQLPAIPEARPATAPARPAATTPPAQTVEPASAPAAPAAPTTTPTAPPPATTPAAAPPATASPDARAPEAADPADGAPPAGRTLTDDEMAANAAAIAQELSAGDANAEAWSSAMFHVTAMINRPGEQILDMFEGNDW